MRSAGSVPPASHLLTRVRCNLCGADETVRFVSTRGFDYVQCRGCGLVYVNPRLSDLRGWHETRYAKGKDGKGPGGDISRQYAPRRAERLAREVRCYARFRKLNRLLDVGCSAGAYLLAAAEEGWQATGVEISESCAQAGRERFGLDIRSGTLAEASFPGGCFDVVRMNNLLEHLSDPSAELAEAHRVLRPGGLLALATINGRSLGAWLSGSEWRYYDPYCHVYVFTPGTLARMLARAGFAELRIRTHGFRWRRTGGPMRRVLGPIAGALGLGHRIRATAVKK